MDIFIKQCRGSLFYFSFLIEFYQPNELKYYKVIKRVKKKYFTVDLDGVRERAPLDPTKKSDKTKKKGFSQVQSFHYVNIEKGMEFNLLSDSPVGLVFESSSVIPSKKIFINDAYTYLRPYDFESKEDAEQYAASLPFTDLICAKHIDELIMQLSQSTLRKYDLTEPQALKICLHILRLPADTSLKDILISLPNLKNDLESFKEEEIVKIFSKDVKTDPLSFKVYKELILALRNEILCRAKVSSSTKILTSTASEEAQLIACGFQTAARLIGAACDTPNESPLPFVNYDRINKLYFNEANLDLIQSEEAYFLNRHQYYKDNKFEFICVTTDKAYLSAILNDRLNKDESINSPTDTLIYKLIKGNHFFLLIMLLIKNDLISPVDVIDLHYSVAELEARVELWPSELMSRLIETVFLSILNPESSATFESRCVMLYVAQMLYTQEIFYADKNRCAEWRSCVRQLLDTNFLPILREAGARSITAITKKDFRYLHFLMSCFEPLSKNFSFDKQGELSASSSFLINEIVAHLLSKDINTWPIEIIDYLASMNFSQIINEHNRKQISNLIFDNLLTQSFCNELFEILAKIFSNGFYEILASFLADKDLEKNTEKLFNFLLDRPAYGLKIFFSQAYKELELFRRSFHQRYFESGPTRRTDEKLLTEGMKNLRLSPQILDRFFLTGMIFKDSETFEVLSAIAAVNSNVIDHFLASLYSLICDTLVRADENIFDDYQVSTNLYLESFRLIAKFEAFCGCAKENPNFNREQVSLLFDKILLHIDLLKIYNRIEDYNIECDLDFSEANLVLEPIYHFLKKQAELDTCNFMDISKIKEILMSYERVAYYEDSASDLITLGLFSKKEGGKSPEESSTAASQTDDVCAATLSITSLGHLHLL